MLLLNKDSEETTIVLCYAVNGVRDNSMAKWHEKYYFGVTHLIKLPTGYIIICLSYTYIYLLKAE